MAGPAIPAIAAGAQAVRSAAPRIIAFIRNNGFAAAIKKYGQSAVKKAVDAGEATVKGGRMNATKPKPHIKPKPKKKDSDAINSEQTGRGLKDRIEGDKKLTANQSDRIGGGSTPAAKTPKNDGGKLTSSQKKKAAAGAGIVAATPAIVSQVGSDKNSAGSSYTIKSGDTISAIAKRMGVRLSEIKAANPQIKDLNKIRPGQKIKVPKASIKGSGKSVYKGMSKSEMAKLAMKKKKKRGSKTGTAPADTFSTGGIIRSNAGASVKPNRIARS